MKRLFCYHEELLLVLNITCIAVVEKKKEGILSSGLILLTIYVAESCFVELVIMNGQSLPVEREGVKTIETEFNESKSFAGIIANQSCSQCQGSDNSCFFFSSLSPSKQPAEILPEPCV